MLSTNQIARTEGRTQTVVSTDVAVLLELDFDWVTDPLKDCFRSVGEGKRGLVKGGSCTEVTEGVSEGFGSVATLRREDVCLLTVEDCG